MPRRQPHQAFELILRQRLGREEIERCRFGLGQQALEHRQVVAEALAARGPRDDHDVEPAAQRLDRLDLVRVEPLDPLRCERLGEWGGERDRKLAVTRRARRQSLPVCDRAAVLGPLRQLGDPGSDAFATL